jgi:5-methylcytosine-specific restriction endonuclease McrA
MLDIRFAIGIFRVWPAPCIQRSESIAPPSSMDHGSARRPGPRGVNRRVRRRVPRGAVARVCARRTRSCNPTAPPGPSRERSPRSIPGWRPRRPNTRRRRTGGATASRIEDFVQEWDRDDGAPRGPDVNETAFIAFGWRCAAPGCTSRRMLQVHHVVYRSHGGGDEKENLLVLCLYHHMRGEHGDLAACRGRSPLGITWRLGPRATGRYFRNERRMSRPIPA